MCVCMCVCACARAHVCVCVCVVYVVCVCGVCGVVVVYVCVCVCSCLRVYVCMCGCVRICENKYLPFSHEFLIGHGADLAHAAPSDINDSDNTHKEHVIHSDNTHTQGTCQTL